MYRTFLVRAETCCEGLFNNAGKADPTSELPKMREKKSRFLGLCREEQEMTLKIGEA